MKKTLLALTVSAATLVSFNSFASIDVYNEKGIRISLEGAAELQFKDGFKKAEKSEIRVDDAMFAVGIESAIDTCLSAIGYLDLQFEQDNKGKGLEKEVRTYTAENSKLWVGFRCSQWGQITVGRQDMTTNIAGVSQAIELGTEEIDFVKTSGDEVIRYQWGKPNDEGLYFGIAYDYEEDPKDGNTAIDAGFGYRQGMYEVSAYYNQTEIHSLEQTKRGIISPDGIEAEGFAIAGRLYLDAWTFALAYGQVDYDLHTTVLTANNTQVKQKIGAEVISGSVKYAANSKLTLAAGFNSAQWKIDRNFNDGGRFNGDLIHAYANVTYKIYSNVKLYAEVGYLSTDDVQKNQDGSRDLIKSPTDMSVYSDTYDNFAYVVGMEIKF